MLMLAAALVCAECHSDLVARFAATPMANTSGAVEREKEPQGSVGSTYRIRNGKLEWPGGAVDLTFFIGSRRMGRSYAFLHDGRLYQAPVGFYANRNRWDLAPGYEHDPAPDFNRPITAECLFCHATSATLEPGTVNRYREVAHGIGCERCHGAPSDHKRLINPAKLSARTRDSVCEQCHLSGAVRLVKAGKRLEDFRAGENIAEYIEVFAGAPAGVRVNGHSDALAMSRCKQESGGKLWCGTCHNPHQAAGDFNAVCRSCHAQPHEAKGADCTGCHMPKAKARDGGHTVFTDHTLRMKPLAAELASYFARKPDARDLGMAYYQLGIDRRDSSYFEKAWPLLREAAARKATDPRLYATVGALLSADGHRQQAAAYFRLSLEQDPLQPDVLERLAGLLGSSAEARDLRKRAAAILPKPH